MDNGINLFEDDEDTDTGSGGTVNNITKTYMDGYKDALVDYAEQCSKHTACSDCPMYAMLGGSGDIGGAVSCRDFLMKFPERAASIIKQMKGEGHTFFDEYLLRFPDYQGSVEDLAALDYCRDAIFYSKYDCSKTSKMMTDEEKAKVCAHCWLEQYPE